LAIQRHSGRRLKAEPILPCNFWNMMWYLLRKQR